MSADAGAAGPAPGDGGRFHVAAPHAVGTQIGDHNIQVNQTHYHYPDAVAGSGDMPSPRWRVFVSSASRGLGGFRDVAREVIENFNYYWGLDCFEPVLAEDSGARDGAGREACARVVHGCDLLVGLAGVRYGAHPPDDRTSYTELEFQAAGRYRLSRLMFLLDPDVAGRLEHDEPQTAVQAGRQQSFRRQASDAGPA